MGNIIGIAWFVLLAGVAVAVASKKLSQAREQAAAIEADMEKRHNRLEQQIGMLVGLAYPPVRKPSPIKPDLESGTIQMGWAYKFPRPDDIFAPADCLIRLYRCGEKFYDEPGGPEVAFATPFNHELYATRYDALLAMYFYCLEGTGRALALIRGEILKDES